MNEDLKHIAVLEELETSVKLIRLGFGELQNLGLDNTFYFLPFQLLSQGFERLMKSYICLAHLNLKGTYPTYSYLKNDLGHDLVKLREEIVLKYFNNTHSKLLEDHLFLASNTELNRLLFILSEFGKLARYHNFDVITGANKPSINPRELWAKFETDIIFSREHLFKKIENWDLSYEVFDEVSRHIIIILETFVSALSRQFSYGRLGEKGTQFSMVVLDFARLFPKDYGKIDYRKNTTRYKQKPRKVHRRTFMDFLNRKFNGNYKSKRVRKSDYGETWPFYADEAIVECRYGHWCVITIKGKDYALNGSSQGKYKLENVHTAGMAVLGMSIDPFIQLAFSLNDPIDTKSKVRQEPLSQ